MRNVVKRHPARLCIVGAIALTGMAVAGVPGGTLAAEAIERSAIDPNEAIHEQVADLPPVLTAADVARYQRLFVLHEGGRWDQAAPLIQALDDPVLRGYVLAVKYLHPTKYRSRFAELRDWLDLYADHPQAPRIYKLAMRRMPKGAAEPRPPSPGRSIRLPSAVADAAATPPPRPGLNTAQRRQVSQLKSQIRRRISRGWPTGALELLTGSAAAKLLSIAETDDLGAAIAGGYYMAGEYRRALDLGGLAARSDTYVPLAHWWAGLAAWRLRDYSAAHDHFGALALSETASFWDSAAGAFWAARTALVAGEPALVNEWLGIGADRDETFYGLLCRRALSLDLNFDWSLPEPSQQGFAALKQRPRGRRALALLQLGRDAQAEAELRPLVSNDRALIQDVLALSSRANMPYLTLKLASATRGAKPAARYPTADWGPTADWDPAGGFAIDRALVHAIVRQESRFDANAKSHAGARGLMQLMPRTASFVGGERSLARSRRDLLFDPALNIELGQRYVTHLLGDRAVGRDLFRLTTAYNAGPGNLRKWERTVAYGNDPLLFIESLPSRETRLFIERVLKNLWIYRHRLGQSTPALDAIAAGDWPRYIELDTQGREVAARGAN